jgi:TonB-dependent Receptor Plug Domain
MGTVTLSGLAFGTYQVRVSSQGFASRMLTVEVSSAVPISREITLSVRSVTTTITAFSPTPIGQASQSRDHMPVRLQGLTEKDLEDSNALDLADLMNKRLSGVYVNENAGNAFQPDMNYRGYTASPLLGTPEGLSVYMDGVRQNQPFGDIVSWDLIPKVAIRDMALIAGSNPIYGLNTRWLAANYRRKVRPSRGRGRRGRTFVSWL